MQKLQNFYPIIYDSQHKEPVAFLENIREFWGNSKDFWFSHEPINDWKVVPTATYTDTLDTNMRLLIHYDQIYRHPNPYFKEENRRLAYRFATHIALRILHSPHQFNEAKTWEKVFILLALRHNKSLPMKEISLKKALALAESSTIDDLPLVIRFLNATIWDIHQWKHAQGYSQEPTDNIQMSYADILEFPKRIQGYEHEKAYKTLVDTFHEHIEPLKSPRIAVSISGGVDSMVAAYIAKAVCKRLNKELILLHINYNNRDCCEQECDLLRYYAHRFEIPLYIRKITEMKRIRASSLRELYEDITRRIRFSFYDYFKCPIILGHNQDDCFENVFTNLANQNHYDNLFGMRPISKEQGVTIIRPMLDIQKKDIVLFADHTGIPHLYDSTPSWSRRGQMRDILIPGIAKFDQLILPGISQFVKYTVFLEQQWDQSLKQWVSKIVASKLVNNENDYQLPRDEFFNTNYKNLNFWIKLWRELILDNRPSNKSINNFIAVGDKAPQCILNAQWLIRRSDNMYRLVKRF
jgi:tRNA(Ile)-lysidine synthetase-like protein